MSYQPSNILKAWTLLVRATDQAAQQAAEQIHQLVADELLHAWLEGWIVPAVAQVEQQDIKPVAQAKNKTKPTQKAKKPMGERQPGQAYKSAPVIIDGILTRQLLQQMAADRGVAITALLANHGLSNGLGTLKSVLNQSRIATGWGQWLIEILGDQIKV